MEYSVINAVRNRDIYGSFIEGRGKLKSWYEKHYLDNETALVTESK